MAFNRDTKCRLLYAHNIELQRLQREEYEVAAMTEFLEGTRVRWVYTFDRNSQPIYREGVVTRPDGYYSRGEWVRSRTSKVNVLMKTGKVHSCDAASLEVWYDENMGAPTVA